MNDPNLRTLFKRSVLSPLLRVALPQLLLGTGAAVVSSIALLLALWCLVQLIGNFTGQWIVFATLLWLVAACLAAYSSWCVHRAEARFSAQLRRTIAQHLIRLPAHARHKYDEHALKRLVSDDIATLHHMIAHLPSEVAIFVVVPLLSIVILLVQVGLSALWVLLPGVLAALYYLVVVPYISQRDGAARMQVMLDIIAKADDYVRGIRINRIYGQQAGALAAYHKATEYFTQHMVAWVAKVATFAAIAVALLQAVATFAIGYWVAHLYDITTLATTLLFSLAVVTPALRLGHGLDYVDAGRAAAARLSLFLQQPELPKGCVTDVPNQAELALVNVDYSVDTQPIISQLNFVFTCRCITMISGPSGVGKSTLLRLMAGLEQPDAGQVTLGHINVLKLDEQVRHQHILYIPQGLDVLHSTIGNTLKLSAPDASIEQLQHALTQAGLAIDINSDAAQLSGGEKQRVNIARAFLTQAPIILLDEPTSALDSATAAKVIHALQELVQTKNKTLIVVSHDQALLDAGSAQLILQGAKN